MKFKDHISSKRTKLLLVGDPGAGKTSVLATLPNAGYNLRIIDFDAGLDVLSDYLTEEGAERTSYVTLTDDVVKDKLKSSAFNAAKEIIYGGWVGKRCGEDLGMIEDWGEEDILVLDGGTFMAEAAKRSVLSLKNRDVTDQLEPRDWYTAQRRVANLIARIMSQQIKCNVILTTHKVIMEDDAGVEKFYPNMCGRGLSTTIGGYFNNIFQIKPKRKGADIFRVIRTTSDSRIDLKSTRPKRLDAEMEPDLAKIFAILQGKD